MERSDFWWLSPNQRSKYQNTEFGHHRPIRDDEDPYSINWDTDFYSIEKLNNWCDKFQNINVYRALRVTSTSQSIEDIIGPFVIDIDNGDEDLEDAQAITRKAFSL